MRAKAIALCASLLLAGTALAAPKRLTSYADLVQALESGGSVRVVADYAKTKLIVDGKEEKAPAAVGGAALDTWERFEKGLLGPRGWISTSHTVLISHPRYQHVYNYVKFRFYDDGTVDVTARYLTVDKFEIVMDEKFVGKISNGKDGEGIHLFRN